MSTDDPKPVYPFPVEDTSARDVAWIVFSRLYCTRVNPLMCSAPIGFRDELQVNFGFICTPKGKRVVVFECDYICEKIEPSMFERLMKHRNIVRNMLIRVATMYPGTARSISAEEAMTLSTAIGLEGVGKYVPLQIENGNPWSSV